MGRPCIVNWGIFWNALFSGLVPQVPPWPDGFGIYVSLYSEYTTQSPLQDWGPGSPSCPECWLPRAFNWVPPYDLPLVQKSLLSRVHTSSPNSSHPMSGGAGGGTPTLWGHFQPQSCGEVGWGHFWDCPAAQPLPLPSPACFPSLQGCRSWETSPTEPQDANLPRASLQGSQPGTMFNFRLWPFLSC